MCLTCRGRPKPRPAPVWATGGSKASFKTPGLFLPIQHYCRSCHEIECPAISLAEGIESAAGLELDWAGRALVVDMRCEGGPGAKLEHEYCEQGRKNSREVEFAACRLQQQPQHFSVKI